MLDKCGQTPPKKGGGGIGTAGRTERKDMLREAKGTIDSPSQLPTSLMAKVSRKSSSALAAEIR